MGWRVVPGTHARVPELVGAAQVRGPASRAGRGDATFLRDVQERAAPVLQRARTWGEVEQGLAQHGLAVRVNGRGMSVTDGRQQVKASEVDRAFSRPAGTAVRPVALAPGARGRRRVAGAGGAARAGRARATPC
jgi:hypothetical protein